MSYKGANEVEGTLTSISSVAEVMVFSTVDHTHELINGESGIKGRPAKFSKINKREVLNKVGEGGKKWNN